jgi:hypothetical protein
MRNTRFIALAALAAALALPSLASASQQAPHRVHDRGPVVYGAGHASPAVANLAASSRSPGVMYGGLTGQQLPIMFQLSRNHRTVVRTVVQWAARCSDPNVFFAETAIVPIPMKISSTGKFAMSVRRDYNAGQGVKGTETMDISGKLTKDRLIAGTMTGGVIETDQSGNVVDRCSTGTVRYRAVQ